MFYIPDPTDECAANYSRKVARNKGHEDLITLSSLMCWESVWYVALKVKIITQNKFESLVNVIPNSQYKLVGKDDPLVRGANGLNQLPPGRVLGFYHGKTLIHTMIYTGQGHAAGNKNNCVGVGTPGNWELLDIANGLNWDGDQISAPGLHSPTRTVDIRHRSLSNLKFL